VAMAGATVKLLGLTSGNVFGLDDTSGLGNYCIIGVPLTEPTYSAEAVRTYAAPATASPVPMADNHTIFQDFTLTTTLQSPACFVDAFESPSAWTAGAFDDGVGWTRMLNPATANTNDAIPACVLNAVENEQCTPDALDPEDECAICSGPADTACIPALGALARPLEGSYTYYFGRVMNANFLGLTGTCTAASGGTSTGILESTLTSPMISLAGVTGARVLFGAWWEIESVDPAAGQFDLMTVRASSNGITYTDLGQLNFAFDRNGAANEPFSSGGFLAAPVWRIYDFDLSAFSGGPVWIQFDFNSNDTLYNGFRGLMIDAVTVVGTGC